MTRPMMPQLKMVRLYLINQYVDISANDFLILCLRPGDDTISDPNDSSLNTSDEKASSPGKRRVSS